MKVAIIGQDMFAQGAQFVCAMMTKAFVSRGYEVDLLLSKVQQDYIDEGRDNQFPVPPETHVMIMGSRHARQCVPEIRRYLKTTDAVVMISMSWNYAVALRLASFGLKNFPRLVYVEHGLIGYENSGVIKPDVRKLSAKGLMSGLLWSPFHRILTVSHKGADDFKRMNPWFPREKIVCVNNPVVDDCFFPKAAQLPTHPWLKERNGEWKTFITAGAYQPYKAHRYLLEAMKIIAGKRAKVRCVIFGQGPLESEYRKFISDNKLEDYISVGGYVKNFPAEANAAFGFVLSSTAESFGIVLVEALACGCRIVSSDPPFGPREILADGKYGTLVPSADAGALAEGMVAAAKQSRGPNPRESWERYTMDIAVDRYADAIGIPRWAN